jgi:hypothetical protein
MAKRDNNYSRTKERADFVKTNDINDTLDYLEKNGKLRNKEVCEQKDINDRCVKYYDEVIRINRILVGLDDHCLLDDEDIKFTKYWKEHLKFEKSELQTKIINLTSIVIGSCIKRFKTLFPQHYDNVFTACVVDILSKIQKNKYNREKSAFHSYMFETSH